MFAVKKAATRAYYLQFTYYIQIIHAWFHFEGKIPAKTNLKWPFLAMTDKNDPATTDYLIKKRSQVHKKTISVKNLLRCY